MMSFDPRRLVWAAHVESYFKREFRKNGAAAPRIRVRYEPSSGGPYDVRIERSGQTITLILAYDCRVRFPYMLRKMLCAYSYWLSLCPPEVDHITVNASDGDVFSTARFAASVRFSQHIALPDPHFFENHGFALEREAGKAAPVWSERGNKITWRGGANGSGWVSFDRPDADYPAVMQRVRLFHKLAEIAGTDFRFTTLPRTYKHMQAFARRTGFLGEEIAPKFWLNQKFAIDVDGHTNTWSNLIVRMLYGCCVLKVASEAGYRQWYYDDLKPFEHFVPIAADLSDLAEKIDWVRRKDDEAREIAASGQSFAQKLTFESQSQRAAQIILANRNT